jgi:membrane protease YdiL (CAAX protease family)
MKVVIRRYPLLSFFVLAFILSWIAVLPLILNPALSPEPFQILGAFVGPTLSSLIVLGFTEGRRSFRPFFARYIQWRAGVIWWLIVLFGTLLAVTAVAAIVISAEVLTALLSNLGLALSTYAIALITGVILGPLWEEPGWRGFALPRLQSRYGPLLGTLVLGTLWAAWHIPGFFGGWLLGSPLALLVSSLGFSIVMTWVYNHTRGSILLMILLHSSSNATLALGAFVLPANMPASLSSFVNQGWIPALTYAVAAAIVVLATRGKLSAEATARRRPI